MNDISIKKLNLYILIIVSIPLLLGIYFLSIEGIVLKKSAFHFYFVLGSALASLFLSMVALKEYKRTKVSIVLMVAVGFLGVSIIYGFHGFVTPGYALFNFDTQADQLNIFVFYGDLSRLWLALFLFTSGRVTQKIVVKIGVSRFLFSLALILLVVIIVLIYLPQIIPNIKNPDGTDAQFPILIKVVTLFLLGITTNRYYNSFKIKPSLSVMFLIIGILFVVESVIIFLISVPWGLLWWMAHVLYLLTYIVITIGVYMNYYKNQKLEYFDIFTEIKNYVDTIDQANKQLEDMVNTDLLTQIPNRHFFMNLLEQTIQNAQDHEHEFGVLFIDIDDFKQINDDFGHKIGDEVLKFASNQIKSLIGTHDTLARFAGDEFVVLLTQSDHSRVESIVQSILNAFTHAFQQDNHVIDLRVSIGIALYPKHGKTAEELINHSDEAMYQVKKNGKDHFKFYH